MVPCVGGALEALGSGFAGRGQQSLLEVNKTRDYYRVITVWHPPRVSRLSFSRVHVSCP